MLSNFKEHSWRFAIGGWGAFVVSIILFLIFDYDLYLMLGLLTAALILTIGNAIYVFYTKRKTKSGEK